MKCKNIIILLILTLLPLTAYPQVNIHRAMPQLEEEDGSPTGWFWKWLFPNGSVTDNTDGTASISFENPLNSVYLRQDGTTPLTANWDAGSYDIYSNNINYNEGLLTEPTVTDATGASVNVTSSTVLMRSTSDFSGGKLEFYTVPANTSLAMTDDSINYIYIGYNSGSPIYYATTNRDAINNSNVIPVYRVYMSSGDIEYKLSYGDIGRSAAIRGFDRVMRLRGSYGIEKESGLTITETATRVVNIASGYAWFGYDRNSLAAVAQGGDGVTSHLWYHSSGVWTSTTATNYNNSQYDNGTDLVSLTTNRYAVNWIYRNLTTSEIDIVLGTGDYTQAQAEASMMPALPPQVANFYVLCGRIIVQQGEDTAYAIENIANVNLRTASVTIHNDLSDLQGGGTNEYYHLDATEFGYLDGQDQAVKTTSDVTFNDITASNDLVLPTSPPASPSAGSAYVDTTNKVLMINDGSTWESADCDQYVKMSLTSQSEGNASSSAWKDRSGNAVTVNSVKLEGFEGITSSTDWNFTLYEKDDYSTSSKNIVKDRDGNIFLGVGELFPYNDQDSTGELHFNYTDDSGSNTINVTITGKKLR